MKESILHLLLDRHVVHPTKFLRVLVLGTLNLMLLSSKVRHFFGDECEYKWEIYDNLMISLEDD